MITFLRSSGFPFLTEARTMSPLQAAGNLETQSSCDMWDKLTIVTPSRLLTDSLSTSGNLLGSKLLSFESHDSSTNQRSVSKSNDLSRPIKSQYPGHMICIDQSEASIQVTWSVSTNQRPVSRLRDLSGPIRSQYPGHMIFLDQSEASI